MGESHQKEMNELELKIRKKIENDRNAFEHRFKQKLIEEQTANDSLQKQLKSLQEQLETLQFEQSQPSSKRTSFGSNNGDSGCFEVNQRKNSTSNKKRSRRQMESEEHNIDESMTEIPTKKKKSNHQRQRS